MVAHDDQAISTQQWLLEFLLPGDFASGCGRDTRQLMNHRHNRTRGSPVVEPGSTGYTGQGIHDDRVETPEVEAGAKSRSRLLLYRGRSRSHERLHLDTFLTQSCEDADVVEVAAGQTARVSHRDEGNAQRRSGQRVFAGSIHL